MFGPETAPTVKSASLGYNVQENTNMSSAAVAKHLCSQCSFWTAETGRTCTLTPTAAKTV